MAGVQVREAALLTGGALTLKSYCGVPVKCISWVGKAEAGTPDWAPLSQKLPKKAGRCPQRGLWDAPGSGHPSLGSHHQPPPWGFLVRYCQHPSQVRDALGRTTHCAGNSQQVHRGGRVQGPSQSCLCGQHTGLCSPPQPTPTPPDPAMQPCPCAGPPVSAMCMCTHT